MSIFDKLKSKKVAAPAKPAVEKKAAPVSEKPAPKSVEKVEKSVPVAAKKDAAQIKGTTTEAYRILLKPLITEKATHLVALNKYLFAVNPKMNKVEIKKAIRTIYKVDPIAVNISNFAGKSVRYGRVSGRTKKWKKAIVSLKAGDKIEVYEGV